MNVRVPTYRLIATVVLALVSGCGDDGADPVAPDVGNNDDTGGEVVCVAGAAECDGDSTLLRCRADGTAMDPFACPEGWECTGATCVPFGACAEPYPGNTSEDAAAILELGHTRDLVVCDGSDDYFRLNIDGDTNDARILMVEIVADATLQAEVLTESGPQPLVFDGGVGRVEINLEPQARPMLHVHLTAGAPPVRYDLRMVIIGVGECSDRFEPNDTEAQAAMLESFGTEQALSLCQNTSPPDTTDWFRLPITTEGGIRVALDYAPSAAAPTLQVGTEFEFQRRVASQGHAEILLTAEAARLVLVSAEEDINYALEVHPTSANLIPSRLVVSPSTAIRSLEALRVSFDLENAGELHAEGVVYALYLQSGRTPFEPTTATEIFRSAAAALAPEEVVRIRDSRHRCVRIW